MGRERDIEPVLSHLASLLLTRCYDRKQLSEIMEKNFGIRYTNNYQQVILDILVGRGIKRKSISELVDPVSLRQHHKRPRPALTAYVYYTDEEHLVPYKNEWLKKNEGVLT